jgi:hypothetical protein
VRQVVEHLLLLLSIAALWAAAARVTSRATPRCLERVVAAAPLAASAAILQALALGLVGLGTSPVALSLASAAVYLLARRLLSGSAAAPRGGLRRWWTGLSPAERTVLGSLAGTLAAWTAWMLDNPLVGADAIYYHSTELAMWVQQGTPGSVEAITETFPVGSYPVTNEVLLAWAAGISRSFVAVTLWTPLLVGLCVGAGWLGLRSLGVPKLVAGLGIAALLATPTLAGGTNGPNTELPALAWLICTAALCAASRERPALLGCAVVAAGLAIGTKTTTAALALLALATAAWCSREHLRRLRASLLPAVAVAFAAGGIWYLRNLVVHGSPLWPFVALPWGDPTPTEWSGFTNTLLEDPRGTLEGRIGDYLELLGGGAVLLGAGLAAPLLSVRRAVMLTAAATGLALFLWAGAPLTGRAEDPLVDFSLTAVRYLLPATAAATAALALAAREGRVQAAVASCVFAGALAWSLERAAALGHPYLPGAPVVLAGATVGALAVAISALLPGDRRWLPERLRPPAWAAAAVATVGAGLALTAAASGYVERHARTTTHRGAVFDTAVTRWFTSQPGFASGDRSISLAPTTIGPLAGDRLRHRLELIPDSESCDRVEARAREGWVVLGFNAFGVPAPHRGALRCFQGQRPLYDDGAFRVFGPSPGPAGGARDRE